MPQKRELTWSELRVGVFVLVGILVVMVGIFYVTGTGFLGAKYRLVTYLPEVDGLTTAAKVTLDGVEIGNVDAIQIASPKPGEPPNVKRSVKVVMRVSRDFQNDIRSDSSAELLTEGFLGDRIVTLQRGYTGAVLQDGQEVPGAEEKSLNEIMANGADLMQNLNELSKQAGAIVDDLHRGRGTLGALLTDRAAYDNATKALDRVNQITASIQDGRGTLGKLATDDTLFTSWKQIGDNLKEATAKLDTNEGTAGKFFNDPKFYDNLTGLTGDMRLLISDFRSNPKKFLHVKFSIF